MLDKRNVEAIYPLSPLQIAFLFRGVDSGHDDPGQLQIRAGFAGELDRHAFETAWQWLVQRHSVLRTSIHWQDLKKPLQVVHRQCGFEVRFETAVDVDDFFHEDRNRPLDLGQAPVQRVTVISTDPGHHTMCWSCHHILLDGWSSAIILRQLMACYRSIIEHTDYQPDPVVPYKAWLKHIAVLDEAASQEYWAHELSGVTSDVRLWVRPAGSTGFDSVTMALDTDFSRRISQQTRALKTTIGLLMQLVWAVALAQVKQLDDVLFGITVSGRSTNLPGIESMVGLFVNSLPLRVRLAGGQSAADLLQALQQARRHRADHEHVSVADLYRWHCLSGQHPFDSLLVVENFPWADKEGSDNPLRMTSFKGDIATHYPLTLVVMPGECVQLKLYFMDKLIDEAAATGLLVMVQALLLAVVDDPEISVGQLRQLSAAQIPFQVAVAVNREPAARPRHLLHRLLHCNRQPEDAPVKDTLLRAWRETLHIPDIDIHDNFFDLGGNSFLGLILIDHINRMSGKQLPLVTIFQAPTIAEMIVLLEQGFGRLPGTRLIPIRQEGDRKPFFMVHGGNWMASILASHLDARQPFYILECHWDFGDIGLDETVEHLAAAYIEDMRSIQPKGPWLIGGYSMGALLAYEMAQQLQDSGEQVDMLFLLDPPTRPEIFKSFDCLPATQPSGAGVAADQGGKPPAGVSGRLARKRQQLMGRSLSGKVTYVLQEVKGHTAYLVRRISDRFRLRIVEPGRVAFAHGCYRCGIPVPVALRTRYVARAYDFACKRYQPQPYNGDLVIFSGNDYPASSIWEHLAAGEIRLMKFDGDHLDFTRRPELIHQWAAVLNKYIYRRQN